MEGNERMLGRVQAERRSLLKRMSFLGFEKRSWHVWSARVDLKEREPLAGKTSVSYQF